MVIRAALIALMASTITAGFYPQLYHFMPPGPFVRTIHSLQPYFISMPYYKPPSLIDPLPTPLIPGVARIDRRYSPAGRPDLIVEHATTIHKAVPMAAASGVNPNIIGNPIIVDPGFPQPVGPATPPPGQPIIH